MLIYDIETVSQNKILIYIIFVSILALYTLNFPFSGIFIYSPPKERSPNFPIKFARKNRHFYIVPHVTIFTQNII